jgi:hypothetical protein
VVTVAARAALLAICAAVMLSCTPDFEAARQVTDLRVLAIRQEALGPDGKPTGLADAFVDFGANTVQPVLISALVADPHPHQRLSARGSVCQPTDSGRCEGVPAFGVSPFLSTETKVEQLPQYRLDVASDVVKLALEDDRLKGFGGIRVQFSMVADDGDPHGPVQASKILLYTSAPESARNANPEIDALEITRDGVVVARVAEGKTLPVVDGVEYGVRPLLKDGRGGVEEYDAVDLSGKAVHLREAPRYSFFATDPVGVDRDDADEPLPEQPPPVNGIARFSVSRGTGTMWVVARDGRGGIGWISITFTAQ